MRVGSLFSGIGGLELGLEWAGVGHTVWQVEQDEKCRQELAIHWPDAVRHTDVRAVGAHNLEPVDVICGGFPCQDISYAGKGAGLEGERSGLWYEFARIVGEMGPRYVVVENVRALLTRGLPAVLGTLADLGYDAEWSVLRASDVGAPHKRERLFLVAYTQRGAAERHGHDLAGASGASESGAPERERLRADAGDGGAVVEHAPRGGWGAGAGEPVRRAAGGCAAVGDAERAGLEGHARHGDHGHQPGRDGTGSGGPVGAPGLPVGWGDAVPVRGHDETVRLIPADAAARGPESPLYPVAHGVPGRVAQLRALGNAVVPACAFVVGQRLIAIDAEQNALARQPRDVPVIDQLVLDG